MGVGIFFVVGGDPLVASWFVEVEEEELAGGEFVLVGDVAEADGEEGFEILEVGLRAAKVGH